MPFGTYLLWLSALKSARFRNTEAKMKLLSEQNFQALIADGKVLERVNGIAKVIALENGEYFKAFFHKSRFSTSRVISRAGKFANNAAQLDKRGIDTITILELLRMKNPDRDCVLYQGVKGTILRDLLQESPRDKTLSGQFGRYLAQLHDKGVMFRSVHLRNVIVQPNGNMGLIDISDMRVNYFSLNSPQRRRNFKHVFRYASDKKSLDLEAFANGYHEENQGREFNLDQLLELAHNTSSKFQR